MLPEIHKIGGVPPSVLIRRELQNTHYSVEQFVKDTGISEELFNAITPEISLLLAKVFKTSDTYFLEVQQKFQKQLAQKTTLKPDVSKINKVLFWDTNFDSLDWIRYKKSIIQRIFERGFEEDKKEIISFYGKDTVVKTLKELNDKITDEDLQNLLQYRLPFTFGNLSQNK